MTDYLQTAFQKIIFLKQHRLSPKEKMHIQDPEADDKVFFFYNTNPCSGLKTLWTVQQNL